MLSRFGRISVRVSTTVSQNPLQHASPLIANVNITVHSGKFSTVPPGGLSFRVRVPPPAASGGGAGAGVRTVAASGAEGAGRGGGGGVEETETLPRIRTVSVGGRELPASLITPEDDAVHIPAAMLLEDGVVAALQSVVVGFT